MIASDKPKRKRPRLFIAINYNQFHDEGAAFTCCASVMFSASHLLRQKRGKVKIAVFYHSDQEISPTFQVKIKEMGLPILMYPSSSNGAGLNHQIDRALKGKYDYFFRVDADDFVYVERFVDQLDKLEKNEADIVGGGLLVHNLETGHEVQLMPHHRPGLWSYCFNQYALHPTIALNMSAVQKAGIKYWEGRLEDKEFYLAAKKANLRISNSSFSYGIYYLNPKSRSGKEIAKLNLKLNRQFAKACGKTWAIPVVWMLYIVSRYIPAQTLRTIRSKLSR